MANNNTYRPLDQNGRLVPFFKQKLRETANNKANRRFYEDTNNRTAQWMPDNYIKRSVNNGYSNAVKRQQEERDRREKEEKERREIRDYLRKEATKDMYNLTEEQYQYAKKTTLDESAKNKEDAELSRKLYYGQLNSRKDLNALQKWKYKVSDIIGAMSENASNGGIKESMGRIAMANTNKQAADAYEYLQALQAYGSYRASLSQDEYKKSGGREDQSSLGLPFLDASIDQMDFDVNGKKYKGYNGLYHWLKNKGEEYNKQGMSNKDIIELANSYEKANVPKKKNTSTLNVYDRTTSRELQKELDQYDNPSQGFDMENTFAKKRQNAEAYKHQQDNDIKAEEESLYKGTTIAGALKEPLRAFGVESYDNFSKDGVGSYTIIPSKMSRKQHWASIWDLSDAGRQYANSANNLDYKDSDFWIWGMTSQYGYSVSSGAGQLGQAIGFAGVPISAAAASVGGPTAGLAAYNATQLVAAPLNYMGGVGENYQEIADKWGDNYKKNLERYLKTDNLGSKKEILDLKNQAIAKAVEGGLSKEEAKKLYDTTNEEGLNNVLGTYLTGQTKSNSINLAKAAVGTTKGLKQQFEADNMRTMASEGLQTAISLIDPTKGLSKVGNAITKGISDKLFKSAVGRAVSQSTGGKLVKKAIDAVDGTIGQSAKKFVSDVSKYANNSTGAAMQTGARIGGAASDILGGGILGKGIGEVAGGLTGGVTSAVKRKMPESMSAGLTNAAQQVANKFELYGRFFRANTKLGKFGTKTADAFEKFIDKHPVASYLAKTLAQKGYRSAKAGLVDHFSEGNEELVQYANSKEDFAKTYGYNSGSLADLLIHDFAQGGKVAKFYAAYLGIGESELLDDAEAVSNWKGGFFQGGLHPTIAANVAFGARDLYKTGAAYNAMVESTVLNREMDQNTRANNAVLADQVTRGRFEQTLSVIDELERKDQEKPINQRLGDKQYWDSKRENLNIINKLVNDKELTNKLQATGIQKGTQEYYTAIADRANLIQNIIENDNEKTIAEEKLNSAYNSKTFQDEIEKIIKEFEDNESPIQARNRAIETGNKFVDQYVKDHMAQHEAKWAENEKLGFTETVAKERKDKEAQYRKEAEAKRSDAVEESFRQERLQRQQNISEISRAFNRLQGLLDLKAQMNTADDWFKFSTEKLGLQSSRPDAKLLAKSIDRQISEAKKNLAETTKDSQNKYEESSDDSKTLQYIEDQQAIGYNNKDIQDAEKYVAIFQANQELFQNQKFAIDEGLIKNKDGEWEYNPEEAQYRQKQTALKLAQGDKYKEDKNHESFKPKDPKKSYIYRRTKSILDAQTRSDAIDWAVADIASGDEVTNMTDQFIQEQEKQQSEIEKEYNSAIEQIRSQIESESDKRVQLEQRSEERRKRFEEKRAQAKNRYSERSKKHKKARRKRARVDITGGIASSTFAVVQDVADKLIEQAQIGYYKYQQFRDDLKDIIDTEDIKGNELTKFAKAAYINAFLNGGNRKNMDKPIDVQLDGDVKADAIRVNPNIIQFGDTQISGVTSVKPIMQTYQATIAINNETGEYEVYRQIKEQKQRGAYFDMLNNSDGLKFLQSIPGFMDNLSEEQRKTIEDIYNKGITEELAEAISVICDDIISPTSNTLRIANTTRNMICEFFINGLSEDDLNAYRSQLGNIDTVINYITGVRDRFKSNGYTVIDSRRPILGINQDGKKVQLEADLLFMNQNGEITVIDVYTTTRDSTPVDLQFESSLLHQDQDQRMKNISQILYQSIGSSFNGYYTLPIYSKPNEYVYAGDRGYTIKRIDIDGFNRIPSEVVPELDKSIAQTATELANNYKQNVDRLQSIYDQLNQIDNGNRSIDQLDADILKFESKTEALLQQDAVLQKLAAIQDEIERAQKELQDKLTKSHKQEETEEFPEELFWHPEESTAENVKQQYDQIQELARNLDTLLSNTPNLKITNKTDRDKVNAIIYAVYSLQGAIDYLYYINGDTEGVYVKAEQDLINNAINKLVQNSDLFGVSEQQIAQWWSTQFSTMYGNQYYTYYTKLKSFVDTFNDQFLDNLVGNREMQAFWSQLLNNILGNYHLVNAEKLPSTGNQNFDIPFKQIITQCRGLIAAFNLRFNVDQNVDTTIDPNSITSINDIDVNWVELHSSTDKHFASFLSKDRNYKQYRKVATDPYLIEKDPKTGKSGGIQFVNYNGQLLMKVTDSKGNTVTLDFNQGNDPGPKGVDPRYLARKIAADKKFEQKVLLMLNYIATHPGYHIDYKLSRSKGSITNGTTPVNVGTWLMNSYGNTPDLYSIKFGTDSFIGVVEDRIDSLTREVKKYIFGGENLKQIMTTYDTKYQKSNSIAAGGNIVYLFHPGMAEMPTGIISERIPTPLINAKFSQQQALEIARMLYTLTVKGSTTYQGYDIMSMLKQVMYIYDPNRQLTEHNSTNSMLYINPNSRVFSIGNKTYDLSSQNGDQQTGGYTQFINDLQQMYIANNINFLNNTISDYATKFGDSALSKVRQQFMTENIDKVTLPNGLTFTREDFTHNGTGSTGLGFFLRNGIVYTHFQGLNAPVVYVSDVKLVQDMPNTSDTQASEQVKQEYQKKAQERRATARSLFMEQKKEDVATSKEYPSFMEAMQRWLMKVTGDKAEFTGEEILSDTPNSQNNVVLAKCTQYVMQMSNSVPYTAGFHEAFHKVFELLVEPDVRDNIYKLYKKYNKDAKTDRDVAEGLADLFVDYMAGEKVEKQLRKYGVIRRVCKKLFTRAQLLWRYGFKGADIIRTFGAISKGKYASKQATEEAIKRFEDKFGESLHYEINGQEFTQIANSADKQEMAKALGYMIVRAAKDSGEIYNALHKFKLDPYKYISLKVIKNLTGYGSDGEVTPSQAAFREVFDIDLVEYLSTANEQQKIEALTNSKFAAFAPEIEKYISTIMDAYDGKRQDEIEDNTTDEFDNTVKHQEDRYDKASFEFDKLDSVSKPAKFFFATVPYMKFKDADPNNPNSQPQWTLDTDRNKYGCPTFMGLQEVYNVICKRYYDIKDVNDLLERFRKDSSVAPMYKYLYDQLKSMYEQVYTYDENGKLTNIDYDKEAIVTQIFNAIKGHVHDFIIGQSSRQGGLTVRVSNAGYDKDAAAYPQMWNTFLSSGQTGLTTGVSNSLGQIQLATKINMRGQNVPLDVIPGQNEFVYIAEFFRDLRNAIVNDGVSDALVGGSYCNFDTNSGIESVKHRCLNWLTLLGIQMSPEALNNMLITKYNDAGRDGVRQWLTNSGKTSIDKFLDSLMRMVPVQGVTTQQAIDQLFNTGFISELGQYIGVYNKLTTDCKVNGVDGKSLHNISQNNAISEMSDNYSTGDKNNSVVKTLLGYSYNIMNMNGFYAGSIVAKQINQGNPLNIHISTPIGFKSDNRNDNGSKYSDLPEADDYINKFAMLQAGYCIFPTLADKGTYMVLSGIPIPGIRFNIDVNGTGAYTVQNAPTIQFRFSEGWKKGMDVDDSYYLKPSDAVINQMIEYAYTEREAILEAREQLGLHVDNPKGLPLLAENEKIENYHTKRQGGIRFNQLTTLRVPQEDGSIKEFYLKDMSPDEQLKTANEQFFDRSLEEQTKIMTLTLQEQAKLEVEKAISLGLIKQKEGDNTKLSGLQNVNLNQLQINALAANFRQQLKAQMAGYNITEKWLVDRSNSLAIMSILQDITYRSIISAEECNRLYIGNHAFFKDVGDVQKRIGGLVSTGEDNLNNLPEEDGTISELYTCAEMKSYEIGSTSDCMKSLEEDMIQGELKTIYGDLRGYSKVDDKDFNVEDELIKIIGKDKVEEIKNRARNFYLAYTKDINVADGASYISADFCKRLLRARGAFNNKIQKAFDILTGEDNYSWKDKRDAFDAIYNEVNFVTTKYTAYGFRDHTANGNNIEGGLAVPYYNKFALFPLFDCLATGKMRGVYDRMKEKKIDNLLTVDAIKVGRQGAIKFNGNELNGELTTYTQRLAALRRQLNTDPEEGDEIAAGTQMIKIALSNLRLDRKYGKLTGKKIRDKFMNSINELSARGVDKFKSKFYSEVNGELKVDQRKLSKYLIEQLGSRGANKNLIDALTIDESTGKMKAPIAATQDASWMESMLISAANKDIVNITTPGSSYVQRSIFAMEGSAKDGDGKIQGAEIYNGKQLQMINPDGSMDAVISMNYFDSILPKNKMSFNEKRQWLIDNGLIGENAKANTIGYRIPTQAQSSIHALRFVDVVPAVKDTIILPAEFTKITGSDFDIDHLYLCSKNFNVKHSENGEKSSAEELQNDIIDCMLTVLQDPKTKNILYKSIDNDTSLVQSIAETIPEEGDTKHIAYNFGSLHEQATRKNDYITGKVGIGPFALNVTNHILTTLYGIKFKPTNFTKITGITGFDKFLDEDNNQISSWLSAFINAHVDIVKDPYISKLNVNGFTYNMINLLARNGKGKAGLYFLCQPVIRQMAKASIDSKSQFTRDPKQYRSTLDMYNDKITKMFPSVVGKEFNEKEVLNIIDAKGKNASAMKAEIVNDVLTSPLLEKIARNPNLIKTDPEAQVFQYNCYLAWRILEPYSAALNKLVQYTKIDTRKQGKNFIEMMAYRSNYQDLVTDTKSLFDQSTIDNLVNNTWINLKTEEAINSPIEVMNGSSFQGSPVFMSEISQMACDFSNMFGRDPKSLWANPQALKKLSQNASSYIKVKYFSNLARELNIDIKGMFEGNKTISDRINALRLCMQRDANGLGRLQNNYLLSHLRPYVVDITKFPITPPKFIEVINAVNEDKSSADMFIESWEELLNDPIKNVRNLARDLIFYAMFTSGDTKGFNKLAKYIPISWMEQQHSQNMPSFVDYIQDQINQPIIDEQEIAQNIFMDQDLMSRTTYDKFDFVNTKGIATVIVTKESMLKEQAPIYVAVRNNQAKYNDPTQYQLYKYAGSFYVKTEQKAVYSLIPKKGYKIANGLQIYEYGNIGLTINGGVRNPDLYLQQSEKLSEFLNKDYIGASGTEEEDIKKSYVDHLRYLTSTFNDPDSDFNSYYEDNNQGDSDMKLVQRGTTSNNQQVLITAQQFDKDAPKRLPGTQFIFADNAQAYCKAQGFSMVGYPNENPKLNVYGNANTAVIRTDSSGVVYPNTIGIVVKLYQQNQAGQFIAQEGSYTDRPDMKRNFASLLNHALSRIDKSKPLAIPASLAMGNEALPKSFAEYLAKRLTEELQVVCQVTTNAEDNNYSGYGVQVLGIPSDGRKIEYTPNEDTVQNPGKSILTEEQLKEGEKYKNDCKGGK